jgi:hypothetical protein
VLGEHDCRPYKVRGARMQYIVAIPGLFRRMLIDGGCALHSIAIKRLRSSKGASTSRGALQW